MSKYHAYDVAGKLKTDVGDIDFDNLKTDMDALRSKGAALKIVDAGTTKIGATAGPPPRDIYALKIGRDPSKKVLLVGCHHAREWISVEIPLLVAKYLVDNYKEKAACKTEKEKRINYLVDKTETWVVPMLNPDGHKKTLTAGNGLWRTNTKKVPFPKDTPIERWVEKAPFSTQTRTTKGGTFKLQCYKLAAVGTGKKVIEVVKAGTYEGVDPNRNYPTPAPGLGKKAPAWGTETFNADPTDPGGFVEFRNVATGAKGSFWDLTTSKSPRPPDTFCGPTAGSEEEVQAVVNLLGKGNFKALITYHNYSQDLLFPDDAVKDPDVQFLGNGMKDLFVDQGAVYKYEPGGGLYPTSGDTLDWAYAVHALPGYTIELPPTDADATAKDWAFNKFPDTMIDPTFSQNLPVALAAINCAVSGLKPGPKAGAPAKAVAAVVLDCWKVFLKASGWVP